MISSVVEVIYTKKKTKTYFRKALLPTHATLKKEKRKRKKKQKRARKKIIEKESRKKKKKNHGRNE